MNKVIDIEPYMTVIDAWLELQKVDNNIELLKTKIKSRTDIKASKLKEVLVQCSIVNNDQLINAIIAKDNDLIKLSELYHHKYGYEHFIQNEIKRLSISDIELCIMFLKEYNRKTWEQISREVHYSVRQCKNIYYEYKNKVDDNTWHNEEFLLKK